MISHYLVWGFWKSTEKDNYEKKNYTEEYQRSTESPGVI
jgi:hypothetical protein